ncbi:Wzz/FepE/Etk N-terminal domain-containing protein [Morganella morganii]|uniref:Wzz/FepE/Etk N-terminal domain-containing protein n=1 Tax=Morganella morganii TaxID=582 RepID=UPI0034D3E310
MVNEKGSVNLNNDEIDIIDLLKLLYRHKVFIVIVTVLFAAAPGSVSPKYCRRNGPVPPK